MNDKDLREKSLFGLNDVFAEFLNAFYRPQNAPPILPEEIADAPTEFVSDIRGGGLTRKFRDVLKCLRSEIGINLAFFGLENQTKSDKAMPIRVMGYDWLVYDNQLKQKTGKQKLIPIVTFVLYFGYDKRWDAPRSLSECFDVPAALKSCFQDYSIRVIELSMAQRRRNLQAERRTQIHCAELAMFQKTRFCFRIATMRNEASRRGFEAFGTNYRRPGICRHEREIPR